MSARNDVAPDTVGVELTEDGILVEYVDGRTTFYHGVPRRHEGVLRCQPGKDVQILVCDPNETEGVMVYINDRKTHDDILESTGVGRVFLDPGESTEVFPGVSVTADGYAIEVAADQSVTRGRVFVFVEDELGEQSFEVFAGEE